MLQIHTHLPAFIPIMIIAVSRKPISLIVHIVYLCQALFLHFSLFLTIKQPDLFDAWKLTFLITISRQNWHAGLFAIFCSYRLHLHFLNHWRLLLEWICFHQLMGNTCVCIKLKQTVHILTNFDILLLIYWAFKKVRTSCAVLLILIRQFTWVLPCMSLVFF